MKIVAEKADKGFYELVIPDVLKEDAGKYSCTATNSHGETYCEATVTVTDDKVIFSGLPEGLLETGEKPNFKWTRDGEPFDPEERFKVLFQDEEDTLALVFQHVKPEDAGLYTCVAQTNTGNISCSAELTVQGTVRQLMKEPAKPLLQSEAKHSEASIGGSAMLDLQVKSLLLFKISLLLISININNRLQTQVNFKITTFLSTGKRFSKTRHKMDKRRQGNSCRW